MNKHRFALRNIGGLGCGIIAVILWSTLSLLSLPLTHVPMFLMAGCSMLVGSVWGLWGLKDFSRSWKVWSLGLFGFFGFHAVYFFALRLCAPLKAQLVVEAWPILLVIFSSLCLRAPLHLWHWIGMILVAIGLGVVGYPSFAMQSGPETIGVTMAFASAVIWALYSVGLRFVPPFSIATNAGFCFVTGLLCLVCHFLFEPSYLPTARDWLWLFWIGAGPLGIAFYCWDYAIKNGDPRQMGALSYSITVLATTWLVVFGNQTFDSRMFVSLALILIGSIFGNYRPRVLV